jgi:peptidyl-tRNA hydrolase, PTH1 family
LLNQRKRKKRSNLIKLIAGLGNPGVEYEKTRHNVGFLAIDRLLEISPAIKKRSTEAAMLFETKRFGLLCKPITYMNRSGKAVETIAKEMDLQPPEILVLYDDFALELGMIRIRLSGSAGGHNGLQSVIDHLGSTHFPRVRLGIQTEEMDSWVDFVLTPFRRKEIPVVSDMLDRCCDAVELILEEGIPTAMNRFNRKQKPRADV